MKKQAPKRKRAVTPALARRPHSQPVAGSEDGDQASPLSRLTVMQRKFVEGYATHGHMRQAALEAGYSGTDGAVSQTASMTLRIPAVQAALEAMLECDPLVIGRVERLRLRSEIARDKGQQPFARLAAIDALDKIDGKLIERLHITGSLHLELESMSSEQLRKLAEEPDVVD